MLRPLLGFATLAGSLCAADPYCPAYPRERRLADLARIDLERSAGALAARAPKATSRPIAQASNFIDGFLFTKMANDVVRPAPPASDAEFLRRVTLDLCGRLPTVQEVEEFLADANPGKRSARIEALIGSSDFVDQWTLFFANHFEVTSGYYNLIGIQGRNLFYSFLRDFVERDRSYRDFVTELLTATGDSHRVGPTNFLIRAWQQGDPIQDTWDTLTDRITRTFLGVQTQCVSCHNGRGHLEQINLYLTARRREEFWRQSAFVSRLNLAMFNVDAFGQQMHFYVTDRQTGGYHGVVNSANPGPRPPRVGGPYEPVYMFTGERPRNGNWRQELARILTADRQFARATVNYIWAHFFNLGIVDPPDGWDLARTDPRNPPPAPWTLQPTHPDLLEALADEFIRSGYSIRAVIRPIVESSAYQLSSRYDGEWRPEYARYFAKRIPRRLSAEEAYDAVAQATMTETPMFVEGFEQPVLWARQLPDPTEPRNIRPVDGAIRNFMNQFGRGDWWQNHRTSETTVLQVLYLMNDNMVNFRTFANNNNSRNTRIAALMRSPMSDDEAVRHLFLATLGRYPSEEEMVVINRRKTPNREQWLSDIQWVLLNKLDFLFNQ
jgi:hypothetical protein